MINLRFPPSSALSGFKHSLFFGDPPKNQGITPFFFIVVTLLKNFLIGLFVYVLSFFRYLNNINFGFSTSLSIKCITASAVVEEPAKKSSITAFLFIRVTILDKYFIRLVGLGFVKISSISISFKRFIPNSLV